jgi:hypothetical protein
MTPPLTDPQKQAVHKYRGALFDLVLTAATTYHRELEKQGIPGEHIAGPLLASVYGAAEKYLRLGGAEDFAKALHNAVHTVAREFHFQITEEN